MLDPNIIAVALAKAGVEKLSPPQRAYLAMRLLKQNATGEISETNLGGLRDVSFGAGKGKLAAFADIDAAARALVSTAYRAAPRNWGTVDESEQVRLGGHALRAAVGSPHRIPISVASGGVRYVAPSEAIAAGAVRNDDGSWNLTAITVVATPELGEVSWAASAIPGYGLIKDYLGPTKESQDVFEQLVKDWEGFERLGIGDTVFGPNDPLTPKPGETSKPGEPLRSHPNLRQQVIDWREFRDAWIAGDVAQKDVAARLNVQRANANMVRKYLAEAKVIDPSLQANKFDAPGVDPERASTAIMKAQDVDKWAKSIPFLGWLTDPSQGEEAKMPWPLPPVPPRILWTIGLGLGGVVLLYLTQSRSTTIKLVGASNGSA